MNRRTFLKLTGATAVLVTTPLSFAKKEETPQWIRLAVEQPRIGQKVVLCDLSTCNSYAWYGKVTRQGVQENNHSAYFHSAYLMLKYKHYEIYHKNKLKERYFLRGHSSREGYFQKNISYRYWIPVKGEFPKTLPPFPKGK